jgi:ribose transport system substrate-binding protein
MRGSRQKKYITVLVACVFIAASLTGCAASPREGQGAPAGQGAAAQAWQWGNADWELLVRNRVQGKTLKIGFTPPAASEFYEIVMHGAYSMMNELHDRFGVNFEFDFVAPNEHDAVESQILTIQGWVNKGFDAVLVCSGGDFDAMNVLYEEAKVQGTSVYLFNMPAELWPEEAIRAESVISYDMAGQAGRLVGEYAAEMLGGDGKILFISGNDGHWTQSRKQGFMDTISEYPGLRVVGEERGEYVRDGGMAAAEKLLQGHPDADFIYAENEEMGQGAVQAIRAMGMKTWDGEDGIIVIALDGLVSGYEQIRAGDSLTATVDVGHVDMGRESIRSVFLHELLDYELDKVQNVSCLLVGKTNVDIPEAYAKWAMGITPDYQ